MPMQSVPYLATTEPEEPASSSFALYAVGGAILCGAITSIRRNTAVAEPDLESATNAADLAKVAILFSSGSSTAPKKTAARKPPPKKAAPKRVVKKVVKKKVANT